MRNGDETKDSCGKCQPESGANDRRTQAPDRRRSLNKRINEVWRSSHVESLCCLSMRRKLLIAR